ncbi:MAG: 4-hydroxythreonine-4-phosphate dehydrogenase PdxA [Bacteroidota bacterium]
MSDRSSRIKVGITQGDINGISYEVIIKTLLDNRINDFCIPIVYGSPKVTAYHRKALNINNFSLNNINKVEEANPKRSNIINCVDESIRVELGKSTPQAGEASFAALKTAVQDLKEKKIDVLVTGPFNKYNIQSAEFSFPGHTEYLQSVFEVSDVLMTMVNEFMRVGVVTGHMPLHNVSEAITVEKVMSKLRVFNQSLITDFGIRKPRIAVLGLNPHAGENGFLGNEEKEQITPAIEQAREEGIMAIGPFASDGFFGSPGFVKFDGVLAMYHDQGLIPFKALAREGGVNYTAGLPVVRTSPAHGTAYEIAGQNQASPDSFRLAMYTAIDIFRRRNEMDELTSNPMKQYDISNI